MLSAIAASQLAIAPTPHAYFGIGAVGRLPDVLRDAGCDAVLVVTDTALATTPVIASVTGAIDAAGMPANVFSGVHPNPTTGDLAAGAEAVGAEAQACPADPSGPPRMALVAVGGGSPIDAAKGIALAAVNPQRGRDLDYRNQFAAKALPIVAVPTTAGTGAETNAFGVVTDPDAGRKFYVGSSATKPAVALLDPELTTGLPPRPTAATGFDALIHAVESYLSARPNPVARMISPATAVAMNAYRSVTTCLKAPARFRLRGAPRPPLARAMSRAAVIFTAIPASATPSTVPPATCGGVTSRRIAA